MMMAECSKEFSIFLFWRMLRFLEISFTPGFGHSKNLKERRGEDVASDNTIKEDD